MFHYLEYYTKKCIPGLYSERAKLEKVLGGNVVAYTVPQLLKAIERIFLNLVVYGSYTTVGLFKVHIQKLPLFPPQMAVIRS